MREVPKEQNKHFNFSEQETVLMFGKLKRHETLDFIKGLIRMGLITIHVNEHYKTSTYQIKLFIKESKLTVFFLMQNLEGWKHLTRELYIDIVLS